MDPNLKEVAQSFEIFKAASVRNDLDTCNNLLSQLKVRLTGFRSLPPLLEETPNSVHELTIARDIYEHAVVLSVKAEDQDAFERIYFSWNLIILIQHLILQLPYLPLFLLPEQQNCLNI
ncbi:hypothetical protein MKX01_026652 [Papaver californicum]|nr:hypothetical protein MKX01_026652 [Papaver californicum]